MWGRYQGVKDTGITAGRGDQPHAKTQIVGGGSVQANVGNENGERDYGDDHAANGLSPPIMFKISHQRGM